MSAMSSTVIERVGDPLREEEEAGASSQSELQATSFVRLEMPRPRVHGKFLFVADQKFWIRGVTYGSFKPDKAGHQFPAKDIVERDFRAIADAGLNSVRIYTAPPLWLMDVAAACGLRVMIGLCWEQHVAFFDDLLGWRSPHSPVTCARLSGVWLATRPYYVMR